MKKIAIINSVYGDGSTGVLTKQLREYGEKKGCSVITLYGRGQKQKEKDIIRIESPLEVYLHKVLALITGLQGYYSFFATRRIISVFKREKIEKVILLNLHGYYLHEKKILNYLRDNQIDTVYITPDEYAGLGKCCYSKDCKKYKKECGKCPQMKEYPKSLFFDQSKKIFRDKKEAYNGFSSLTLLGPETNLIKFRESALTKHLRMISAPWGVDLSLYVYKIDESLYEKYQIPRNKIIVLTVASYSIQRKGVKEYFFEVAKQLENSEYHFVNVGYDGDLPCDEIPVNMTTIPYVNNQEELACLYSMSDLYVLASTTDTMPLSCLISFSCSTPVCCFYTSGLKYLADRNNPAVYYCDNISVEGLKSTIMTIRKKNIEIMDCCRKLAEQQYSKEAFSRKVYEALECEDV